MFSVGEKVIYGAVGVCLITDIIENELTGVMREYYVLRPVDSDKSVIYVPTNNEKLVSRMREVPSSQKLRETIKDIKGKELLWIDNNLERSESFRAILSDGDIESVAVLFRTLHKRREELSERGKRLVKSDENLYRECSKLLCSEFAIILSLEQSQVLSLILEP
ncbi:MAG: hypothetical protein IJE16_02050 [Ruminococcus sp.]|nr:hypothetical protein [Ruminococcus sp.]